MIKVRLKLPEMPVPRASTSAASDQMDPRKRIHLIGNAWLEALRQGARETGQSLTEYVDQVTGCLDGSLSDAEAMFNDATP